MNNENGILRHFSSKTSIKLRFFYFLLNFLQNNDLIRQNEKLKVELREAQRQLQKMKTAAANSERSSPEEGGEGKGSPDPEDGELSEGQLIMRLKNQGLYNSMCFRFPPKQIWFGGDWRVCSQHKMILCHITCD